MGIAVFSCMIGVMLLGLFLKADLLSAVNKIGKRKRRFSDGGSRRHENRSEVVSETVPS